MALARVKTWAPGEVLTATDLNTEFSNILNNPTSLISPFTGGLDFDGFTLTLDAAAATTVNSSSSVSWNFISGAKAGTPATTGTIANWSAQTFTDSATAGAGTAASYVAHAIQRPTLAATNSTVTTTNAASLYIANAPAAGTNETITNSYSIWSDDGRIRFDLSASVVSAASAALDALNLTAQTATISGSTNITNATGVNFVTVGAPTYSAASALTITNAATLYIAAAPAGAGAGPATITNAYALWVDSGAVRFDGAVATGALTVTGDMTVSGASIPQNSQSVAYTTVLADANKHILHPTADNNARTFTIDSNANVAYAIGTAITFVNQINTVTIAITTDTMTLAGAGSTGSRTLAANGMATALKVTATSWVISGTGLT